MLAVINIKKGVDRQPINKTKDPSKFKIRDLLLFKVSQEKNLGYKIFSNFSDYKVIGDRAYDLQDTIGHIRCASVADIKLLMPAEYMVSM